VNTIDRSDLSFPPFFLSQLEDDRYPPPLCIRSSSVAFPLRVRQHRRCFIQDVFPSKMKFSKTSASDILFFGFVTASSSPWETRATNESEFVLSCHRVILLFSLPSMYLSPRRDLHCMIPRFLLTSSFPEMVYGLRPGKSPAELPHPFNPLPFPCILDLDQYPPPRR